MNGTWKGHLEEYGQFLLHGRKVKRTLEREIATISSSHVFVPSFIFHISCRYSERWGDVKGHTAT